MFWNDMSVAAVPVVVQRALDGALLRQLDVAAAGRVFALITERPKIAVCLTAVNARGVRRCSQMCSYLKWERIAVRWRPRN